MPRTALKFIKTTNTVSTHSMRHQMSVGFALLLLKIDEITTSPLSSNHYSHGRPIKLITECIGISHCLFLSCRNCSLLMDTSTAAYCCHAAFFKSIYTEKQAAGKLYLTLLGITVFLKLWVAFKLEYPYRRCFFLQGVTREKSSRQKISAL